MSHCLWQFVMDSHIGDCRSGQQLGDHSGLLESFPDDLQTLLLHKLVEQFTPLSAEANVNYIILLSLVDKYHYQRISHFAIHNKFKKVILCTELAAKGHINILNWILECRYDRDSNNTKQMTKSIVGAASQEIHQYWDYQLGRDVCDRAIEYGQLETLKWLRSKGCFPWCHRIVSCAARRNQFEIVQWAMINGCYEHVNVNILYDATRSGNLKMTEWLWHFFTNIPDGVIHTMYHIIGMYGYLDILKWIYSISHHRSLEIYTIASRYGHLKIPKWLKLNDNEWEIGQSRICIAATQGNQLNVLLWARYNMCKIKMRDLTRVHELYVKCIKHKWYCSGCDNVFDKKDIPECEDINASVCSVCMSIIPHDFLIKEKNN